MQKYTELVCDKFGIDQNLVLKKKIRGLPGITAGSLITALVSTESVVDAAKLLGYTENPVKQCIRTLLGPHFTNRTKSFGVGGACAGWRFTLLGSIEYKLCSLCKNVLHYSQFHSDTNNSDGINSTCASCKTAKSKEHKLYIRQRTPSWSDTTKIRTIYNNCPEGYHVDHIIPLRGDLVSWLHVPENLQYLPAKENLQKSNKFIPYQEQ